MCGLGAQRFVDLARGVNGVGFRLAAKIDGISPVQPISPRFHLLFVSERVHALIRMHTNRGRCFRLAVCLLANKPTASLQCGLSLEGYASCMWVSDYGCKLVVMRESHLVTLNKESSRRRLPYRGTSEASLQWLCLTSSLTG